LFRIGSRENTLRDPQKRPEREGRGKRASSPAVRKEKAPATLGGRNQLAIVCFVNGGKRFSITFGETSLFLIRGKRKNRLISLSKSVPARGGKLDFS